VLLFIGTKIVTKKKKNVKKSCLKGTDSFEVKKKIILKYKHKHAKAETLFNVLGTVLETHFLEYLELEKDLISFNLPHSIHCRNSIN